MVSLAFAGVGQIVRLCLISGESASARTHCLLGPHASCPASQAIRVRTEQVPDMLDQTRSGEPAPRSREALPPEWERRCGGNPTVQEGGGDPSIKKKTPTVLGIQQRRGLAPRSTRPHKHTVWSVCTCLSLLSQLSLSLLVTPTADTGSTTYMPKKCFAQHTLYGTSTVVLNSQSNMLPSRPRRRS